jgi:uncharacterized membrane protein YgcG
MATYFKYAERNADSQINWAEVGRNITEMLDEEVKIRDQKKQAIDEASRKFGETLLKSPQGDHEGLRTWSLKYADDAQQARLLQDRLLKSGKLSLRDYNIMRQNLVDGTNQAFNLISEYDAEYKDKMQRFMSEDPSTASQKLEAWLMEQAEGFANFQQTSLYINPTSYAVSIGKMKDGANGVKELSEDPNDFTTVNALRNRIKSKYDKFDADTYLKGQVSLLGKFVSAERSKGSANKAGQITTIEDVMARSDYKEMENQIINSAFADPYNLTSWLTENVVFIDGQEFDYDWEGGKKTGKNIIKLKQDNAGNPIAVITDEQRKAAEDAMRLKIQSMLGYEEKIQTYAEPQKSFDVNAYNASNEKKRQYELGKLLAQAYAGGNDASIQQALDSLANLGYSGGSRNDTGISFVANGVSTPISFGANFDEYIRAAAVSLFGPNANLSDILAGANAYGNKNQTWTGKDFVSIRESQQPSGTTVDTSGNNNYVNQFTFITEDNPSATASNINNALQNFGFIAAGRTDGMTDDIITVKAPNGDVWEGQIDDTAKELELKGWITQHSGGVNLGGSGGGGNSGGGGASQSGGKPR